MKLKINIQLLAVLAASYVSFFCVDALASTKPELILGKASNNRNNYLQAPYEAGGKPILIGSGFTTSIFNENAPAALNKMPCVFGGKLTGTYQGSGVQMVIDGARISSAAFAGNQTGEFIADTQLSLISGYSKFLFAGSYSDLFKGNSHMLIKGGSGQHFYGGNFKGHFEGASKIEVSSLDGFKVQGGSRSGDFIGNSTISVNSAQEGKPITVIGGNSAGRFVGDVDITLNDGIIGHVVGANSVVEKIKSESYSFEGDVNIRFLGGVIGTFVGGSTGGDFKGKVSITLDGASIKQRAGTVSYVGGWASDGHKMEQDSLTLHLLKGDMTHAHICMAGRESKAKGAITKQVYAEIKDTVTGSLTLNGAYHLKSLGANVTQTLDFTSENGDYSKLDLKANNFDAIRMAKGTIIPLQLNNQHADDGIIKKYGLGIWVIPSYKHKHLITVCEGSIQIGNRATGLSNFGRSNASYAIEGNARLIVGAESLVEGELIFHNQAILDMPNGAKGINLGRNAVPKLAQKGDKFILSIPTRFSEKYKQALFTNSVLRLPGDDTAKINGGNIVLEPTPNDFFGMKASNLLSKVTTLSSLDDAWLLWDDGTVYLTNHLVYRHRTVEWKGGSGQWAGEKAWMNHWQKVSNTFDFNYPSTQDVILPKGSASTITLADQDVRLRRFSVYHDSAYTLKGGRLQVSDLLHMGRTKIHFENNIKLDRATVKLEGSDVSMNGDSSFKSLEGTGSMRIAGGLRIANAANTKIYLSVNNLELATGRNSFAQLQTAGAVMNRGSLTLGGSDSRSKTSSNSKIGQLNGEGELGLQGSLVIAHEGETVISRLRGYTSSAKGYSFEVKGSLVLKNAESHSFNGNLQVGKSLTIHGSLSTREGALNVSDIIVGTPFNDASRSLIRVTQLDTKELNVNMDLALLEQSQLVDQVDLVIVNSSKAVQLDKLTLNGKTDSVRVKNFICTLIVNNDGDVVLRVSQIKPWPFPQ